MKYNDSNKPMVCMQTTSRCYKNTHVMTVKGILWHSTGCNNPNLKRYVQPSDNAPDRDYWLNLLGKNLYKNDWNHSNGSAGMNCWIGKLADGTVTTVQTMPWNYRPWGCSSGKKGSCNDGWIQFEICEDNKKNKDYFNKVYKEACEITAYLCKMYNLDPFGTTIHNGVKVPVILCHADSYKLKLGNNHSDVYNWFNRYGKDMDDVRRDVAALMKGSGSVVTPPAPVAPSIPTTPNIVTFTNYQARVTSSSLNIREKASTSSKLLGVLKKGSVVTVIGKDGVWERIYEGWIHSKYTEKIDGAAVPEFKPEPTPEVETPSTPEVVTPSNPSFKSYKVKVTSSSLNIREGASTGRKKVGVLKKGDIVTVIGKNGVWEQISKGWIHSKYTKEVTETTVTESKPTTTTKPESTFTPYKVRIASKTLNVRKGPGSNYEVIDVVKKDEIYTIVGEYSGKGASGWLKLADDKGYIGKGSTRKVKN